MRSAVADGTPWYGPYGAGLEIWWAFVNFFFYGIFFVLLLCGCCDRRCCSKRFKTKNLAPIPEENEEFDVKEERDRVNDRINNPSGESDMILVHNLVKKYDKKEPDAHKVDSNAMQSDRPLD